MASREVEALIAYIKDSGVPYKVTDINTPRVHSATSFHYAAGTDGVGLAVDLAGPTPGDVAAMSKIFDAFRPVAGQLAEMIFKAPGVTKVVKAGKWVEPLAAFGPKVWAMHTNHVHVATYKGIFVKWTPTPAPALAAAVEPPTKRIYPMYQPPVVCEPIVADLACPTGGAWCLAVSGAIYGWAGAPHKGAANGQPYFEGRKAARLNPNGAGYTIVAESGEKYDYP